MHVLMTQNARGDAFSLFREKRKFTPIWGVYRRPPLIKGVRNAFRYCAKDPPVQAPYQRRNMQMGMHLRYFRKKTQIYTELAGLRRCTPTLRLLGMHFAVARKAAWSTPTSAILMTQNASANAISKQNTHAEICPDFRRVMGTWEVLRYCARGTRFAACQWHNEAK